MKNSILHLSWSVPGLSQGKTKNQTLETLDEYLRIFYFPFLYHDNVGKRMVDIRFISVKYSALFRRTVFKDVIFNNKTMYTKHIKRIFLMYNTNTNVNIMRCICYSICFTPTTPLPRLSQVNTVQSD